MPFQNLFSWCLDLLNQFSVFLNWLSTPLDVIGISPLMIFTFSGLTLIIGFHVLRLVIGG